MIKYYLLERKAEFFGIRRYMMTSGKTKIIARRKQENTEYILTGFEKKQYKVKEVFASEG